MACFHKFEKEGFMDSQIATRYKVAAFFDLDNTIMRGASIFHLARGLFSRKFLSTSDLISFAIAQGKFLVTGNENKGDMARVTQDALMFVAGRSVSQLTALGEEIYHEIMESKIWPETVALAQKHLAAGHEVWLVSAAPIEIAELIARKLKLTGAIGTKSEIIDGKYTGKLINKPMHGEEKAIAIRELAVSRDISLPKSFGYSDSSNDLPLLSSVGYPQAVNPDSKLRNHAKLRMWPIHDFKRQYIAAKYTRPLKKTLVATLSATIGIAFIANKKTKQQI